MYSQRTLHIVRRARNVRKVVSARFTVRRSLVAGTLKQAKHTAETVVSLWMSCSLSFWSLVELCIVRL